jgi:hypothetical protein
MVVVIGGDNIGTDSSIGQLAGNRRSQANSVQTGMDPESNATEYASIVNTGTIRTAAREYQGQSLTFMK